MSDLFTMYQAREVSEFKYRIVGTETVVTDTVRQSFVSSERDVFW